MGLDFSHGTAHWSYGGFHRARTKLAAVLGIELDAMQGFGGNKAWPDAEKVPLVGLLYHSDCDGDLTPDQCRKIAPALRAAVQQWPADDFDRDGFNRLADAMDEAAAADEPLEFM